jgi:hypothetical protein
MSLLKLLALILLISMTVCCVKDFAPVTDEYGHAIIIEGLITDQPAGSYVKLSATYPLWRRTAPKDVSGCTVSISDDLGNLYILKETFKYGVYSADYMNFRGAVGREYTLRVNTTKEFGFLTYESEPTRMIPVPSIDSLYYQKKIIKDPRSTLEGCDIFLDTRDPESRCQFFKWEYLETWEYHLPFEKIDKTCWLSVSSDGILIKNSTGFSGGAIKKQPVLSINNPVEKLNIKYSILVRQYSLNENEFLYWDRLKNLTDQTGGFYDIIPSDLPNNLYCVEDSLRKILGYFSVSSVTSKRLFIKEKFQGSDISYNGCMTDFIYTNRPDTIPGLDINIWILEDHLNEKPPYIVCTRNKSCVFCEARGTSIKPDFWDDDK